MALNEGKDILAILQGQEVRIPDIEKLVSEWDLQINPNEDQVKKVVDDILATYTVSTRVNAKLTKNKLSRYVSTCYPFADRETLAELTYFVCWMFLVDDEIDHIVAPGQNQEERLSNLWSEVLHLVENSCSITGVINGEERTNKKPLEAFRVFGKSMRHKYTIAQSGRYWAELVATSRGYQIEQQFRDLEELPDYASYCKYRYGRCCMGQVVALMEYANGLQLPTDMVESAELKKLREDTVTLLWLNNDIVSLKKELEDNFLENLVVISAAPSFDLQKGLDHCIHRLEETVQSIDETSSALLARIPERCTHLSSCQAACQKDVLEQTLKLVSNCKSTCRGIVMWSIQTPRYGLAKLPRHEDSSLTFVVDTIKV